MRDRENRTELYLREQIELLGGICIKFPPLFFRGFPDRIILLPKGVILFVETKAERKNPTLLQARVHRQLTALGFRVEVIHSAEEVNNLILSL